MRRRYYFTATATISMLPLTIRLAIPIRPGDAFAASTFITKSTFPINQELSLGDQRITHSSILHTSSSSEQEDHQQPPPKSSFSSSSSFSDNDDNQNKKKATSSFNDVFLNSLENDGNASKAGGVNDNDESIPLPVIAKNDPSPDSLEALRDMASTNVANFLATFSQPPTDASGDLPVDTGSQYDGNIVDTITTDTNEKVTAKLSTQNDNGAINDQGQMKVNTNHEEDSRVPQSLLSSSSSETKFIHWDVYICQSKQCIERGASATLDSFQALLPSAASSKSSSSLNTNQNNNSYREKTTNTVTTINIHPAILSKTKAKGPNVRCIQRTPPYKAFEVNNVNDIDKVYRILTKYMSIQNVSIAAKDCLKNIYLGNSHLEKNELTQAIQYYNKALEQNYESQAGMILLLRATAYLKKAFQHQEILRQTVSDLGETVSDPILLGKLYSIAEANPSLSKSIFQKVLQDAKAQDKKFRLTKYRHGLYEYSLLHAAQDSLRATQLLPHHAKTWLRAGDALAELRKLKESALYYEKAMELDPSLRSRLEPVVERLIRSQEFLEKAKGWWSSDTLRLALDVAG